MKNKLEYRFRIHDQEEEKKILESHILVRRKIGVQGLDKDLTYDEFLDWRDSSDKNDYMIRVYFNGPNPSLKRFKTKVRELLGTPVCGNFHCSEYECEKEDSKCPFTTYKLGDSRVEYLWRCIWHDETDYSPDDEFTM